MKALKSIGSAVLAAALAFTVASCANDDGGSGSDDSSKLPKSVGANNLSGNSFELTDDDETTVLSFKGNTYTVTVTTENEEEEYSIAFTEKTETTYKYSFDSELSVVYSTPKSETSTILDSTGKVIYTYPSSLPSTMAAYRKMSLDAFKAVLTESAKADATAVETYFNEEVAPEFYYLFEDYGYTDRTGESDDEVAYAKYLKEQNAILKYEAKKVDIIPYELSGSTLKVGNPITDATQKV